MSKRRKQQPSTYDIQRRHHRFDIMPSKTHNTQSRRTERRQYKQSLRKDNDD